MIDKLGGRKLALMIIITLITVLLMMFSAVDQAAFMEVIRTVIIAYPTSNIAQKAVVSAPEPISDDVVSGVDALGGKKFVFVVSIFALIAVLVGFKQIDISVYSELTTWLIGTYCLANVAGKGITNGVSFTIGKPKSDSE